MKKIFATALCAAIGMAATQGAIAQPKPGPKPTTAPTVSRSVLSSAGTQAAMAAAVAEATKNGWPASIAIVDDSGRLLAFHRTDGAPMGTIDVARRKAETSIKFKMPTEFLGQMVQQGGPAMLTLGDFVAVPGGYPIMAGGEVIAAIGVSGGMAGEDDIIAKAGIAAIPVK